MATGTAEHVAILRDARNRNRLLPISTLLDCRSRAGPTSVRAPQDEVRIVSRAGRVGTLRFAHPTGPRDPRGGSARRGPNDRGQGAGLRGLPRRKRRSARQVVAGDLGPAPGLSLFAVARLQERRPQERRDWTDRGEAGARRNARDRALFLAESR